MIFFTVSGGPYGLEPLVGAVGARWAVALVVATPLLWSAPIALMVSELSSALPDEGGYYVWVRRGLGSFWGVQEGWWTICYTAVDMAIYPVLFVNYLAYFFPSLALDENGASSWTILFLRWMIAAGIITIALCINLRGARAVGRNALVNTMVVLLPLCLLVILSLTADNSIGNAWHALARAGDAQRPSYAPIAFGLATILWNYCGWDNVSTFAAEVKDARRSYPRALMVALPLIVAVYLLPLLAGIAFTTDADVWSESAGWPVIGQLIGGRRLGIVIAIAALASAWSLFNSQLLYVSRLPFVMAQAGWLPRALARVSSRTGVPTTALIASCSVSAIFAALPFGKLVIIDILLYAAALTLEFAALFALRLREPLLPRPFAIRGGWPVLLALGLAPMGLALIVIIVSLGDDSGSSTQAGLALALMAGGPVLYYLRRKKDSV